jgi:hypothetical protein
VALTVSSAEATTPAVGNLTYGGHHLSTDDSGRLRTNAASANGGCPSAHKEVLTPVYGWQWVRVWVNNLG